MQKKIFNKLIYLSSNYNEIVIDTENKEEKELEVQGSKMELSHSITSKTEFKSNSSNKS